MIVILKIFWILFLVAFPEGAYGLLVKYNG